MMTDPIADMLARVRNASLAQHAVTRIPASKLKQRLAEILKAEGYIMAYDVMDAPDVLMPKGPIEALFGK